MKKTVNNPDWLDIKDRPEFGEWVREKRSRVQLAITADAGDIESAIELFDDYKSALETGNATPKEAVRRDRQARSGVAEKGTPKRPVGQMYTRTELQNLRAYNPRRYEELLPDIRRAYSEGRVTDG